MMKILNDNIYKHMFKKEHIIPIRTRAYADVLKLLLAHGADIPPIIKSRYPPFIKDIVKKWPALLGIPALQGLSLFYILDASTIIDIY